jgi:hypothetical protein
MQQNSGIDYKKKYMDLRARFVEALDVAFRTGYEQGSVEAQQQAMAQQQQIAQQQAMSGQQQPQEDAQDQQRVQAMPNEVNQAVAELDGLVNKSELTVDDLKKSIQNIKNELMFKSLSNVTKSLNQQKVQILPPPGHSIGYRNLPESHKQAVSMQGKLVDDIFKKWEQESQESTRDLANVLGVENILAKKE